MSGIPGGPRGPPPGNFQPGGWSAQPRMPPQGFQPFRMNMGMQPPPAMPPHRPPVMPTNDSNSPSNYSPHFEPQKKSPWTEHQAADGRTFFYNSETKRSVWEKPDDLKSRSELLLSQCSWKEHRADDGRTYYYNSKTKESIWTKPKELLEIESQIAQENVQRVQSPVTTQSKSAIMKAMEATLSAVATPEQVVEEIKFKNKSEMVDAFKKLLSEKKIGSNTSWENALKAIQSDSIFSALKGLSEKKQIFNQYKTQRAKEEKEEQRQKQKKAKEELESFLVENEKVHSNLKFRKAEQMFLDKPQWRAVHERDRREVFQDAIVLVAKREKEEAKRLRKQNIKKFSQILDKMPDLSYRTTWTEAQQMLLDNTEFTDDHELQNMDKEDALICFEDHIKELEKEHDDEKEQKKKMLKRQQRKNREGFLVLLDELHETGQLNSMSLWMDLYVVISQDQRFTAMLGQSGSTPLDLFKFYVEDLKARFYDEKKTVKDILKDKKFTVETNTKFEEMAVIVASDKRSENLDKGNLKLTYNSLIEKAEAREKEREKEEARKVKKIENNFKNLLAESDPPIQPQDSWQNIRSNFASHPAFLSVDLESERERFFKEYLHALQNTCFHQHKGGNKARKKVKKRSRSNSRTSGSEDESRKRKKKKKCRSRSPSESHSDSEHENKRHKKSKKKKSRKSKSLTPVVHSASEEGERTNSESELSEGELERRRQKLLQELEDGQIA